MSEIQPSLEIRRDYVSKEHGLCDAAETHWALYLIQAIEQGKKLQLHEASVAGGGTIRYLVKGENKAVTGFTFGAESMFLYASEDPDLENMIVIEESEGVWMGRPVMDFGESLRLNLFDDPEISSRWKGVIAEYAKKMSILPSEVDLRKLVEQTI